MNLPGKSLRYLLILLFLISIFNYPYSASGEPGEDIKLNRSETLIISGFSTCDNISLSDEATLILKNADLRVSGIIRMSGYARLFVENSKLKLQPPEINDSTIVVHITDYAMIKVTDGSTVEFDPQPNPTNISYMLMEDNSEFFLIDSIFRGDLPSIINQSIEVASVTAGVYLLSGFASWYMIDSDITGTVSLEGGDLTGRWFWATLHQRASFNIDNTDLELLGMSESYTLLKPVSGSLSMKDSNVLGGKVDIEVAAQGQLRDSNFSSQVRIMDSTMVEISGCTFHEDVFIGTTLSMGEGNYNPETQADISLSNFEAYLRCFGNTTANLFESTINNLYTAHNSTISVVNSSILGTFTVRDKAIDIVENSNVKEIKVHESASLEIKDCPGISVARFYGTNLYEDQGNITISGSSISSVTIQDNFLNWISFKNVEIGDVSFYEGINTSFELVNSSIESITPIRVEDNVSLTFLLVSSQTPDLFLIHENITVHIFHRLEVRVNLNGENIETKVEITDEDGQKIIGETQNGIIEFDLHYKTKSAGGLSTTPNYNVFTSYLAISESKDILLTSSQIVVFDFIDSQSPEIYGISIGPSDWNLGKDITVKVKTSDVGVESISSTYLFYRIDGGKWNEIEMFKIDDNTYEAVIPKQSQSGTITYYISSWDKAQNQAKTDQKKLVVGSQEDLIYSSGIFILVIFIAFLIVRKIATKRKIKNYANKFEFRKK